jgi:hypothetical protein
MSIRPKVTTAVLAVLVLGMVGAVAALLQTIFGLSDQQAPLIPDLPARTVAQPPTADDAPAADPIGMTVFAPGETPLRPRAPVASAAADMDMPAATPPATKLPPTLERVAPPAPLGIAPPAKWQYRDPAFTPPAGTPPLPAAVAPEEPAGGRPLPPPAFGSIAERECEPYGGRFNALDPASAFDVQILPGEIVMRLRRDRLDAALLADEDRRLFEVDGRSYDAMILEEELTIRIGIEGMGANAGPYRQPVAYGRRSHPDGRDPTLWPIDLPGIRRHQVSDLYPGIDMGYYADGNRMEYVFFVDPGADFGRIRFSYETTGAVTTDPYDNVRILLDPCAKLILQAPRFYERRHGTTRQIDGRFHIAESGALSPALGGGTDTEDTRRNPRVETLGYFGGNGDDAAFALALDQRGTAVLAGRTGSTSIPGAARGPAAGAEDVFVARYRVPEMEPLFTATLGGAGDDQAAGVAIDAAGNLYICGTTTSADFPGRAPAAGGSAAYVAKFDPTGSNLLYTVLFDGAGDDRAYGLAVSPQGTLVVVGETTSPDLPLTRPFQDRANGGADGFIAVLSAADGRVAFATYLGGVGDDAVTSVAFDPRGDILFAGYTRSNDLPARQAWGVRPQGATDGFYGKWDGRSFDLRFLGYLGGENDDRIHGIAGDTLGDIYLAGETASHRFPTTNAVQQAFGGGKWDAFVVRLRSSGMEPVYSTFLGGSGEDRVFAVAPDAAGYAHVVGATTSTNAPVRRAVQPTHAGGVWDGYVARLEPDGRSLSYATYLGGGGSDHLSRWPSRPAAICTSPAPRIRRTSRSNAPCSASSKAARAMPCWRRSAPRGSPNRNCNSSRRTARRAARLQLLHGQVRDHQRGVRALPEQRPGQPARRAGHESLLRCHGQRLVQPGDAMRNAMRFSKCATAASSTTPVSPSARATASRRACRRRAAPTPTTRWQAHRGSAP